MFKRRSDLSRPAPALGRHCVLLCLAVFLTSASAQEATQVFKSPAHGYSIQLPADWHAIPDDELRRITESFPKEAAHYASGWEAVYQESPLTTEGRFIHPYVICRVLPYDGGGVPTEAEIAALFNSLKAANMTGQVKTGDDALDQTLAATTMDRPRYDAPTHTVFQSMKSGTATMDATEWIVAAHFGRYAEVDVMVYDRVDTFSSHRAVFEQIQSSFRFDQAAAYPPKLRLPLVTTPPDQQETGHPPQDGRPAPTPVIGLILMWVFEKFGWVGVAVVLGLIIYGRWADRKGS
ncbi:MAG TPA: hypothetical protein VG269_15475 [Tepidisphaeraceae bacterium]|jgi:hypothetical protein|nr:hypothetical protein [Tepidisphaeraceae bacterium]